MTLTVSLLGNTMTEWSESNTNYNTITIGAETDETDVYFQGSQAVSAQASNKAGEFYYDRYQGGTNSYLDFGSGGNQEDHLVGIWINVTTLQALDTLANNGLSVRLFMSDSTSNYIDFTVAGSGYVDNFRKGKGGYTFFVLDPTLTPTSSGGTVNLAQVSYIGLHIDTTASSKTQNVMIDGIVVAQGIQVTGSDTNGWLDAVDYSTAYSSRAWGFLEYDDTEQVIYCKGKLVIGDSSQSANTSLTDSGRKIVFTHTNYYRDGNWYPMVKDDYMGISAEDHASYTTTFQDGILVGTDAGRSGSNFIGDPDLRCYFDFSGLSNNAASVVKLYGSVIEGFSGTIQFKNDSDWEAFSVTWSGCSMVDPVGAMDIKNNIFQNTVDCYKRTWNQAWEFQTPSTYNDETTDINDAGTADVQLHRGSGHTAGDIFYFGHEDQFESIEIVINAADSGSPVIVWEYYNGSWINLATAHNLVDGTVAFTKTGLNKVKWDFPTDWTTTSVNSVTQYYVRARWSTAGATTAVTADIAYANTTSSGSALKWNSSWDVDDSSFIANTHTENNCHAVEHDTATTETYFNLTFSGNDYDIHFIAASGNLTISKNGTSDPSSADNEGTGSTSFVGASVTCEIKCVDVNNQDLSGVRVLAWVTSGVNYPYQASVSITGSGTTATVTHNSHGLTTGEYVWIEGANEDVYNGQYQITVSDGNTYTYTTNETIGVSPATGTITSTFVILSGTTDGNGEISDTRQWTAAQPIAGRAAKSTSTPLYKRNTFSGTISTTEGYARTLTMISDEG